MPPDAARRATANEADPDEIHSALSKGDNTKLFASPWDDQNGGWPYGYPMVVEDIGPYASLEQVMTALALVVDERGVRPEMAATMTLGQALTATGLETTEFEQKVLID